MAGCALIGGETAEMPSFYNIGEYDLAGFAVGVVEKDAIVDGSKIKEGDAVIGLASNGLHSNGYSLVRHILFDINKLDVNDFWEGTDVRLYEELLKPTRIYVKPVLNVMKEYAVKGMVHITGGGLPGNIKRIIPEGLSHGSWKCGLRGNGFDLHYGNRICSDRECRGSTRRDRPSDEKWGEAPGDRCYKKIKGRSKGRDYLISPFKGHFSHTGVFLQ
jgi:hypothetical protein